MAYQVIVRQPLHQTKRELAILITLILILMLEELATLSFRRPDVRQLSSAV